VLSGWPGFSALWYAPAPMDGRLVLDALVAFVAEHQRCAELDGGLGNGVVWLACSVARRSPTRLARLPQHRHGDPSVSISSLCEAIPTPSHLVCRFVASSVT
jgi:hypothetical protein